MLDVTPSRRQFLAGAAGALVLPHAAATADAAATVQARPAVLYRGRSVAVTPRGDRLVVAHLGRRSAAIVVRRTQATKIVALPGHPLEVAISPDGHTAAITTAFWDHPGVTLLDLRRGVVLASAAATASPLGITFTHDGRSLVVSGGTETAGELVLLDATTLKRARGADTGLGPQGLALDRDQRTAWVALSAEDGVMQVDLATGKQRRRLSTGPHPDRLALSPDGRRMLVSHGGPAAHSVTELDLHSGHATERPVGLKPSGVAWPANGRRVVALGASDELVVIDSHGHRSHRKVGTAPRGLTVLRSHAFTVSAITGQVSRVRL